MCDSDQWKLSAYWHNEYNRFVYMADRLRHALYSGGAVQLLVERGEIVMDIWTEAGHAGCARGTLLPEVINSALDDFDLCRKSSSGDSAGECDPRKRQVVDSDKQGSDRLEGNLRAVILPRKG